MQLDHKTKVLSLSVIAIILIIIYAFLMMNQPQETASNDAAGTSTSLDESDTTASTDTVATGGTDTGSTASSSTSVKTSSSATPTPSLPANINSTTLNSKEVLACLQPVIAKQPSAPAAAPDLVSYTDEGLAQYKAAFDVWFKGRQAKLTEYSTWKTEFDAKLKDCYNAQLAKTYGESSAEYKQAKW